MVTRSFRPGSGALGCGLARVLCLERLSETLHSYSCLPFAKKEIPLELTLNYGILFAKQADELKDMTLTINVATKNRAKSCHGMKMVTKMCGVPEKTGISLEML